MAANKSKFFKAADQTINTGKFGYPNHTKDPIEMKASPLNAPKGWPKGGSGKMSNQQTPYKPLVPIGNMQPAPATGKSPFHDNFHGAVKLPAGMITKVP